MDIRRRWQAGRELQSAHRSSSSVAAYQFRAVFADPSLVCRRVMAGQRLRQAHEAAQRLSAEHRGPVLVGHVQVRARPIENKRARPDCIGEMALGVPQCMPASSDTSPRKVGHALNLASLGSHMPRRASGLSGSCVAGSEATAGSCVEVESSGAVAICPEQLRVAMIAAAHQDAMARRIYTLKAPPWTELLAPGSSVHREWSSCQDVNPEVVLNVAYR